MRFFNGLAAYGAFGVFKKLQLVAPFAFTADHDISAAAIAFFASGKSRAAAEGAGGGERSSAAGAYGVSALNFFQTVRAMIPERAGASTLRAEPAVPLNHFTAMDTRLFVGRH